MGARGVDELPGDRRRVGVPGGPRGEGPGDGPQPLGRGLRVGSRFCLLHRTAGGGRVVLVGGSRIALGSGVLQQLRAEVAG